MGDKHERCTGVAIEGKKELYDLLTGFFVEVASRFVSKQNLRLMNEGARDGDALLLSAGKLGGVMVQPISEAHSLQ